MFAMNSSYTLENLLASAGAASFDYTGLGLSFTLSTDSVPSDFSIRMENLQNKLEFRWNPRKATSHITTYVLSSGNFNPAQHGQGSWAGKQVTTDLPLPYKEVKVLFEVIGDYARVNMTVGGKTYEVSYDLPVQTEYPERNVKGWKMYVESLPVLGSASSTNLKQYAVTADSSTSGSVAIEYITLTETNVTNKFVEIADDQASEVAVNIAQAITQKYGEDYIVEGNKLFWGGYGMDTPHLTAGLTLRVVYFAGTHGRPYYQKVGKRLIGLGGHGETTNG